MTHLEDDTTVAQGRVNALLGSGDADEWRRVAGELLLSSDADTQCRLLERLETASETALLLSEELALWLVSYALYVATADVPDATLNAALLAATEAVSICFEEPLCTSVQDMLADHIVSSIVIAPTLCHEKAKSVHAQKRFVGLTAKDIPLPVAYSRAGLRDVLLLSVHREGGEEEVPNVGDAEKSQKRLISAFSGVISQYAGLGKRCAVRLLALLPEAGKVRQQVDDWLFLARMSTAEGAAAAPAIPPCVALSGKELMHAKAWIFPLLKASIAGMRGGEDLEEEKDLKASAQLREWAPHLVALLCCVGIPFPRGVAAESAKGLVAECAEICAMAGWLPTPVALAALSVSRIPKAGMYYM